MTFGLPPVGKITGQGTLPHHNIQVVHYMYCIKRRGRAEKK